jgi:hypothetical protein
VVAHVRNGVPLVGRDGGELAFEVRELVGDARTLRLGLLLRLEKLLFSVVVEVVMLLLG